MITSLPPGLTTCGRRCEQPLQVLQFAIYEDSESLKRQGRRMDARGFHWPGRGRYDLRKMRRTPDRPRPNNGSGDSPRPPFLTEFVNHVGERSLVEVIYNLLGGALGLRIHTHVERSFRLKTETAGRVVQLQGTDAQVGQNPVGLPRRHQPPDFGEGGVVQGDGRPVRAQLRRRLQPPARDI